MVDHTASLPAMHDINVFIASFAIGMPKIYLLTFSFLRKISYMSNLGISRIIFTACAISWFTKRATPGQQKLQATQ